MKKKKMSYIRVAARILIYAFNAAPLYLMADCTGMILSSMGFVLGTFAIQNMFEAITAAAQTGNPTGSILPTVFFTVAVLVFNELMNALCNFLAWPANFKIRGALKEKIHKKIEKLPALDFENAETLEYIRKASEGAENGIDLYHSVSTLLTFYGPYFVVMGIYLYSLRPILVWCIFFIFIPMLFSQYIRDRVFSRLIDESVPLERKVKYYENEMYRREYFKETRILGIYSFIKRKYDESLELFCNKRWKAVRKVQLAEIGLRSITLMGYTGVLLLMVSSLLGGYISVGAFAAVFAAISTLIAFMNDAVSNYLGRMLESYGSLRNLLYFLDLPEDAGCSAEMSFGCGIDISGVTFRYPNSGANILENISLHIEEGETVAFVGKNGAGKTTLVRLITGILPPSEGRILVNGVPITDYAKESRFKSISGVIQRFGKYKMTLNHNVMLSESKKAVDALKLYKSLKEADFSLEEKHERFTDGIDTMLSCEFGGIDLSGGEWQRVALARGLYKDSRLMILDEPTSAIDPIEESLFYEKFRKLAEGRTAILVTHRLGSAKIADRIAVLDKGRIIEIGTHEQLMEKKGKYAEMFNSQAKWYK